MENPPADELLKKILELEESQEYLKQETSRLKVSVERRQRSHSVSMHRPGRRNFGVGAPAGRKSSAASAGKFTNQQYLNILQSIAQSVHVLDLNMRIIFWNTMSEKQFGYTAAEVVGKNPIDVMVNDRDAAFAMTIVQRCVNGETWTGEFPVKTKSGETFSAVTTVSPFYDDHGSLVGIISITADSAQYLHSRISLAKLNEEEGETSFSPARNSFSSKLGLDTKGAVISNFGLDSDQPIQAAITSKISSLESKVSNKVRSKMRAGDTSVTLSEGGSHRSDHGFFRDDAVSSGASRPRGDFIHSPFGVFRYDDEKFPLKPFKGSSDGKSAICKVPTSKAEEWIVKEGNEQDSSKGRQNEQEKDKSHQIYPSSVVKSESHSSVNANSTSSCTSVMKKVDTDSECLEYEILWDDLKIGEQIGQGSCGTVYHGLWFGSDVAVKVFSKQEYSEEVIQSFRQEVSLMKRLRHPNVLLFMGAVTSPQRLSIVSEFLPRGSLYRLLQRSMSKLDWRRRMNMALDILPYISSSILHHSSHRLAV